MDKYTFSLGCIACIAMIEGAAIVCGRDGALLAALTAIIGAVAGGALGITITKVEEKKEPE